MIFNLGMVLACVDYDYIHYIPIIIINLNVILIWILQVSFDGEMFWHHVTLFTTRVCCCSSSFLFFFLDWSTDEEWPTHLETKDPSLACLWNKGPNAPQPGVSWWVCCSLTEKEKKEVCSLLLLLLCWHHLLSGKRQHEVHVIGESFKSCMHYSGTRSGPTVPSALTFYFQLPWTPDHDVSSSPFSFNAWWFHWVLKLHDFCSFVSFCFPYYFFFYCLVEREWDFSINHGRFSLVLLHFIQFI